MDTREDAIAGGVAFRTMTLKDVGAGLRLCRASRWNQVARDWELFLTANPGGALAAVRDTEVVGTVATLRFDDRFGWIAMVLVDPAERGRGIGTALLHRGLELIADLPVARLDATPLGYPIYRKLGFEEEYHLLRMEAIPPKTRGGPSPPNVRRMSSEDVAAAAALDRDVFAADRGAVLAWMQAGAPEYAWVAEDGSGLAGYCVGRHGFNFEHIGPVVAREEPAARALVDAALAPETDRAFIIDVPRHAGDWTAWLEGLGFREQRPFIRMCRGRRPHDAPPPQQFAILGPEFG